MYNLFIQYGCSWHCIMGEEFYSAISFVLLLKINNQRKHNFIILTYPNGSNLLIFRCSPIYPPYNYKFKFPIIKDTYNYLNQ